ncbi:MAG: hypothetical protein ACLTE2_04740 [Eubacteriales bacterium]
MGTGSANTGTSLWRVPSGVSKLRSVLEIKPLERIVTLKDSNENILFDFSPELPYIVV